MNIEEMRIVWKAYDESLKKTTHLTAKLVISMIAERSGTRVDRVKRKYRLGILWMLACLAFGGAVIVSNPFDFRYGVQYIPIGIYCICLLILTLKLMLTYQTLDNIMITQKNIREALIRIIKLYEEPHKVFKYTIIVFLFSQVVLLPLSFLPRNIEKMGLWSALGDRLIPILISGLMLWGAFKLGLFKDKDGSKFRQDFDELNELKTLSRELGENQ